jgi:hypothetical protein
MLQKVFPTFTKYCKNVFFHGRPSQGKKVLPYGLDWLSYISCLQADVGLLGILLCGARTPAL